MCFVYVENEQRKQETIKLEIFNKERYTFPPGTKSRDSSIFMAQIIFIFPCKTAWVHSCIKIDPMPKEVKREVFNWLQLTLKKIHR